MSPSGGSAWCFHCAQRPELVNAPDFSIQCVVGRKNTSVCTSSGATPGACQNSDDAVGKGSITTNHLRFDSDSITRFESGPIFTLLMPPLKRPWSRPARASSWNVIHDQFLSGFGSHENPKSLSFVAASPNHCLRRLTVMLLYTEPKKLRALGSSCARAAALT